MKKPKQPARDPGFTGTLADIRQAVLDRPENHPNACPRCDGHGCQVCRMTGILATKRPDMMIPVGGWNAASDEEKLRCVEAIEKMHPANLVWCNRKRVEISRTSPRLLLKSRGVAFEKQGGAAAGVPSGAASSGGPIALKLNR